VEFMDAFHNLQESLDMLSSGFTDLMWVITQGKPLEYHPDQPGAALEFSDHYLAGRYEDEITALLGLVEEAREAASTLASSGFSLPSTRLSLKACQKALVQLWDSFEDDLSSPERVEELAEIKSEKDNPWQEWSANVLIELGRLHQPLRNVRDNLFRSYQAALEQSTKRSLTMQKNTNIGQQFRVPDKPESSLGSWSAEST
jgi:hypothetical protein